MAVCWLLGSDDVDLERIEGGCRSLFQQKKFLMLRTVLEILRTFQGLQNSKFNLQREDNAR